MAGGKGRHDSVQNVGRRLHGSVRVLRGDAHASADITASVAGVPATAGIDRGVVTVFATGSTVGVITME
jgi:thiamine phosphate synthase YjbQ (UPF0047 family)